MNSVRNKLIFKTLNSIRGKLNLLGRIKKGYAFYTMEMERGMKQKR